METGTTKSVDVVIIGAGMAGLSAARALLRGGTTDLLVVEARDRIGGRIHTVTLEEEAEGKHVIDYGAQFIHGCDGNPVYEIAKEYDLVAEDKSDFAKYEKDDAEANSFFTPRGQMIDPGIVEEVLDVLDGIFLEADKFARENVPIVEETETIGTFVHRKFYKYLRTKGDSDEVFQMKEGIFNWRLMLEKTDNACKSIYELSPWGWGEYVECSGVDHLDLKHGFQSILDVIKSEIPERYFCLRCPVQSIYWQPEVCKPVPFVKGIRTKQSEEGSSEHSRPFSDENDTDRPIHILTGTGQVIRANHVIVTASLGCLKRKAHTMFKPLLPSDKLAVIQRMGFGTVDKLILEFEKPFWDKDSHGLQFAWLTDEPFTLSCVENKYQEEYLRDEWYQGIQGFDTMYGLPNMLCGWIAGDEAELMETVPDAVVLDICHELLQRFTNNPELPKPIRLFRSNWHMSNYVWGSYSYMKYGNSSIDCDILAQPLLNKEIPRVMFAGEATHRQFFSTAHGALLSGEREANRVLEWHRKATKSASDVN